jgi:hypothetical protein
MIVTHINSSTTFQSVLRNILALALFWVLSFGLVQAGSRLFDGWIASSIGEVTGAIFGIALALRLGARFAAYLLTASAAFSAAGVAIHAYYGIRAAQGAPVYFAMFVAALLAVVGTLFVTQRATVRATA